MISIIVPIYNAASYLPACLDSLLRQTEHDLQLILVDDGSTDDSPALARAYASQDPRIEVYAIPHAGQSAARNEGMRHANGEFVAFVDADDTLDSDWCERMLAAIEGVDYVQAEGPRNRYQYTVVWGRLYRREAIAHIRFVEGMVYEDILWSVDLWLSGASCRCIDYKGYHYTLNPSGTTSQRHPEAEQRVFAELKKRVAGASRKGKMILLYTIIRLKLHFIKQ